VKKNGNKARHSEWSATSCFLTNLQIITKNEDLES